MRKGAFEPINHEVLHWVGVFQWRVNDCTRFSMLLNKITVWAHLGHAHLHGELHWSAQKLYESLSLGKWNDICLASELFGCLQPTAQPAYSGLYGEHLPSV